MKKLIYLIGTIIIFAFIFNYQFIYNTNLILCNNLNWKCNVIARFKDYETCKNINERWNWFCDKDVSKKITCKEWKWVIGFSYCKN